MLIRLLGPFTVVGAALLGADKGWGLIALLDLPYLLAVTAGMIVLDLIIYAQHVYRGELKATPQQMKAAIECLSFESPKLSAVGVGYTTAEDFASRLDRAIERTNGAKLIEGRVIENRTQVNAAVSLKAQMTVSIGRKQLCGAVTAV